MTKYFYYRYVKWMMYWIVFALFTSVETFSDFFFSFWFPFYYEIKIVFLIWLLSPATKGSSLLYRKFVHPQLLSREQKIDEMIVAAQTRSYDTAIQLGQRGVRWVLKYFVILTSQLGQMIPYYLQYFWGITYWLYCWFFQHFSSLFSMVKEQFHLINLTLVLAMYCNNNLRLIFWQL